jgi:formylglycine-generating enzyme required for sulfatase activity
MYFVNYNEALDFCKELTARGHNEGWLDRDWKFTLPTEAQWEYACRAGTTTAFSYGSSSDVYKMNFNGNYPYGGAEKGVYRGSTVEVGSLGYRNAFGLYDMHGNVLEWCLDYYNSKFYRNGAIADPLCTTGSYRVMRGGSCYSGAQSCRSAIRDDNLPTIRYYIVGFRLALVQTD